MSDADGPWRDARVHVLAAKCATCIFRPGNPMALREGRRDDMVAAALRAESAIVCHDTLYRDDVRPAVCRGFYDVHGPAVLALRLAHVMRVLAFDELPPPHPRNA